MTEPVFLGVANSTTRSNGHVDIWQDIQKNYTKTVALEMVIERGYGDSMLGNSSVNYTETWLDLEECWQLTCLLHEVGLDNLQMSLSTNISMIV